MGIQEFAIGIKPAPQITKGLVLRVNLRQLTACAGMPLAPMRPAVDLSENGLAGVEQLFRVDAMILMHGDGGTRPLVERAHPDVVGRNGTVFERKARID